MPSISFKIEGDDVPKKYEVFQSLSYDENGLRQPTFFKLKGEGFSISLKCHVNLGRRITKFDHIGEGGIFSIAGRVVGIQILEMDNGIDKEVQKLIGMLQNSSFRAKTSFNDGNRYIDISFRKF